MSNSLDPDQAQHVVRPGLGPHCLQRLSAYLMTKFAASRQSVNVQKLMLCTPENLKIGALANREDPDEILQNAASFPYINVKG